MKRFLLIPIVALAIAACQSPQPAPPPTSTAGPPTSTPAPAPPVPVDTLAPTAAPTTAPTVPPTAAPTAAPTTAPPATATPPPSPATSEAYANAPGGLNLRAEASTAATLLRTLPFGTHLTVIGQPTAPDAAGIAWQNVRTDDGQSGWVAAQYLSSTRPEVVAAPTPTAPPATGTTPSVKSGYVYVASVGGLNLRASASASAQQLALLANGQRLATNALTSGPDSLGITWLNVRTDDGVEGWVSAQFVSAQVPSVAPATPPPNVSDAVAEILRRTNDLRARSGLAPYALNDDLSRLALTHSQYMSQNGITHVDGSGLSARQRIANAGFGGRPTENIYGGQATIDQAWDYWATDPPHLDNLLNRFNTLVGIGVYKIGLLTYYTMDFAAYP